jgi:hypothetical protein
VVAREEPPAGRARRDAGASAPGGDLALGRTRTLRIAADVVAAVLGLNLWVSFVLVPGLFIGSFARVRAFLLVAPVPLAVLAVGIARRSPLWLLLVYPATLLVPVALDPRTVGENAQSPWAFALIALSLVGFFLGSSYLCGPRDAGAAAPALKTRRLGASLETKSPARWRRRRRIYVALGVLAAAFPAALVYKVDFAPETRAYLAELYPGDRTATMIALLNLGALVLWLAVFAIGFVGPLRHHRTGDQALIRDLERLRIEARRPTPRLGFYVGVLCALGLMAVLLYMRAQGAGAGK